MKMNLYSISSDYRRTLYDEDYEDTIKYDITSKDGLGESYDFPKNFRSLSIRIFKNRKFVEFDWNNRELYHAEVSYCSIVDRQPFLYTVFPSYPFIVPKREYYISTENGTYYKPSMVRIVMKGKV